jgi:hypothetical protein
MSLALMRIIERSGDSWKDGGDSRQPDSGKTGEQRARRMRDGCRLAFAEGEEILRAFDGMAEAAEEFLQILIALDEIYFGGVDNE